jgi:hypothetical protein
MNLDATTNKSLLGSGCDGWLVGDWSCYENQVAHFQLILEDDLSDASVETSVDSPSGPQRGGKMVDRLQLQRQKASTKG